MKSETTITQKEVDVVLHVGAPKTGSSALQVFLLENVEALLKSGYYYPEHGVDVNRVSGGHSDIGVCLFQGKYKEAEGKIAKHLAVAQSKNATLVLSGESYYGFPEFFKNALKDYRVKVICFYRNVKDAVPSFYNQLVKRHFYSKPFEEYILAPSSVAENPSVNGDNILLWSKEFKSDFLLVPYERQQFPDQSIEKFFMSMIGVAGGFEFNPAHVNSSYNASSLELKRRFNFLLSQKEMKLNGALDRSLQWFSDNYEEPRMNLYALLNAEQLQKVNDVFKAIYERVYQNVGSNFLWEPEFVVEAVVSSHGGPMHYMYSFPFVAFSAKSKFPEEYAQLRSFLAKASMGKRSDYKVNSLCEAFNLDSSSVDYSEWELLVEKLLKDEAKIPDMLRDVGKYSLDMGDVEGASKLVKKALERRPNGKYIQKLDAHIDMLLKKSREHNLIRQE
ncbi:hypothetical protein [Saccharospirillum salsuginis]|nr:hypothetical protein [Saccharospirillum salsuginis]